MAKKLDIVHKRSSVAGKEPLPADLTEGELAINMADGKAFVKKTDGNIVEIGKQERNSATAGLVAPLDTDGKDGDTYTMVNTETIIPLDIISLDEANANGGGPNVDDWWIRFDLADWGMPPALTINNNEVDLSFRNNLGVNLRPTTHKTGDIVGDTFGIIIDGVPLDLSAVTFIDDTNYSWSYTGTMAVPTTSVEIVDKEAITLAVNTYSKVNGKWMEVVDECDPSCSVGNAWKNTSTYKSGDLVTFAAFDGEFYVYDTYVANTNIPAGKLNPEKNMDWILIDPDLSEFPERSEISMFKAEFDNQSISRGDLFTIDGTIFETVQGGYLDGSTTGFAQLRNISAGATVVSDSRKPEADEGLGEDIRIVPTYDITTVSEDFELKTKTLGDCFVNVNKINQLEADQIHSYINRSGTNTATTI